MCSPACQKKCLVVCTQVFLLASLIKMYAVLQKVQLSGSKIKSNSAAGGYWSVSYMVRVEEVMLD